jgi:hypothetical protein
MWLDTFKKQSLFLVDEAGGVNRVVIGIKKYEAILRKLNRFKELRQIEKAKRAIVRKATEKRTQSQRK